jgi:hypothetical protein
VQEEAQISPTHPPSSQTANIEIPDPSSRPTIIAISPFLSAAVILSKAKDLCTFAPGGAQNPHNKKAQPEGYAMKSIIT